MRYRRPKVEDSLFLEGTQYDFPTEVIFQPVARLLSDIASHSYRGRLYTVEFLKNITKRDVEVPEKVRYNISLPACFTTFIIVDEYLRVLEILFGTSPAGPARVKRSIRETSRTTSFADE
jgi:hypothetical protein